MVIAVESSKGIPASCIFFPPSFLRESIQFFHKQALSITMGHLNNKRNNNYYGKAFLVLCAKHSSACPFFLLFLQYIMYAFERTRKTSISLEVSLYISSIHLIDLFIGSCHCCQRREKKLNCISTQTTISVYIL